MNLQNPNAVSSCLGGATIHSTEVRESDISNMRGGGVQSVWCARSLVFEASMAGSDDGGPNVYGEVLVSKYIGGVS